MSMPWERLREHRRALGMKQAELAHGIASQSLISHMERGGRIVPSDETLVAIADRLGCNREEFLGEWQGWRQVNQIRDQLWAAVCSQNGGRASNLLRQGENVLSTLESLVYRGWVHAQQRHIELAEQCLERAWFLDKSLALYRRLPVIDAWTRQKINQELHRTEAALHWQAIAKQRWAVHSRTAPPDVPTMI